MKGTAIHYIDSLKHWELSPWLLLSIRLGVLNFLILSLGFYVGVATPATGLTLAILSKLYVGVFIVWVGSLMGYFTARYRHLHRRMV